MHIKNIYCFECHARFPANAVLFSCLKCKGALDIDYNYEEIKKTIVKEEFASAKISHWKYAPFYPINDLSKVVSLSEGNTPLIKSKNFPNWQLKFEGMNPTGSFKDRGTTIEITKAMELGVKQVACASTGNMGASVAAYAARAGIKATIFLPRFVAANKIMQIKAHGASINRISGDYTAALNATKKLRSKGFYLMGDYPFRGEGEKSIGFEIADQFGWRAPRFVVCPIGNGTLLYSVFKAFNELKKTGFIDSVPKIVGVQAKNCAPVVNAFKSGAKKIVPIKNPKTIATAIACGAPVDGLMALHALRESNGLAESVTEKEILLAKKELGKEGIFAESSGAVSFAGAKKLGLEKEECVILVTGHGLKETK